MRTEKDIKEETIYKAGEAEEEISTAQRTAVQAHKDCVRFEKLILFFLVLLSFVCVTSSSPSGDDLPPESLHRPGLHPSSRWERFQDDTQRWDQTQGGVVKKGKKREKEKREDCEHEHLHTRRETTTRK